MIKTKIKKIIKTRLFKYVIVSGSGIFVNYFFLFSLNEILKIYYLWAAAVAIEISIISNFIFNNLWTFKDRKNKESAFLKFLRFNLICFFGLLINVSILRTLKEGLGFNLYIAEFFGILGAFIFNFYLSNVWAWRKK